MTDPRVAVILPTLDGADFIGEQLDALFGQTCRVEWHLIVVDGGSTDTTLDVVASRRPTPVPMQVIRLTGAPGVNVGINAGVSATTSPLILIAEHDDVVAPGWIQALADALATESLVGSHIRKSELNAPELIGTRRSFPEDVVTLAPMVDSTGMGFRRCLWEELGGFDPSFKYGGNDAEFCFRAHRAGHTARRADGALVDYRIREGSGAAYRQARAYGSSAVRLFAEFGPDFVQPRRLSTVAKDVARLTWWAARATRSPYYRRLLAYRGGLQVGYLTGSLRYRRWFL